MTAFRRVVLGTFSVSAYLNVVSFATSILAARLLEPQGRGEIGLLLVYSQMAFWLAGLGLTRGHVYHLSRDRSSDSCARILTQSVVYCAALGIAIATIMILLTGVVLAASHSTVVAYGSVFFGTLPLMMMSDHVMNILLGLKEHRLFNIKRVLLPSFYSAAILLLFALDKLTVANLILAHIINIALELAISLGLLRRCFRFRWVFDKTLFRDCFFFGLKAYPVDIAETANQNIDQLIVAPLLGTYQFGIYAVARSMANAITILPASIATHVFPEIASRKPEDGRRLLKKVVGVLVPLLVVSFVALYFGIPLLVSWFLGDIYSKSAELARILLVGFAFVSISQVIQNAFFGMKRQFEASAINAFGVVLNIALLAMLVPAFALSGVAIAFVLGCTTKALLFLYRQRREVPR